MQNFTSIMVLPYTKVCRALIGVSRVWSVAVILVATGCGFAAGSVEAFSCADNGALAVTGTGFGTLSQPFAVDSPWNRTPIAPVLSDFAVPLSQYFPTVAEGQWSTGIFLAQATDPAVTVTGTAAGSGVKDSDTETNRVVTIPHWPANVMPAAASDGHAEIVDASTGIIHSFWQLKQVNGQWQASLYSWSCINGTGFGDPAHYDQGARAAGVPTMAGLIRKSEFNDGNATYHHALTMSLTFNAIAANPAYIAPATSADWNAATTNTGQIPEGGLVMLPASFDSSILKTAALRKIAETLKTYGAYVVDRNVGTPFVIYVENGTGFNLNASGWNANAATDLQIIRAGLHQVTSTSGWKDGNGNTVSPKTNVNLLSMRGSWVVDSGSSTGAGAYDTWQQAVVFPVAYATTVMRNDSNRGLGTVAWAIPATGSAMKFTASTNGGAKVRFLLNDQANGATLFDSGYLSDGDSKTFVWPSRKVVTRLYTSNGVGQISSARGVLINQTNP